MRRFTLAIAALTLLGTCLLPQQAHSLSDSTFIRMHEDYSTKAGKDTRRANPREAESFCFKRYYENREIIERDKYWKLIWSTESSFPDWSASARLYYDPTQILGLGNGNYMLCLRSVKEETYPGMVQDTGSRTYEIRQIRVDCRNNHYTWKGVFMYTRLKGKGVCSGYPEGRINRPGGPCDKVYWVDVTHSGAVTEQETRALYDKLCTPEE